MWRATGVAWGLSWSLHEMGTVAWASGERDHALALFRESLALFHTLGDKRGLAAGLEARGRRRAAMGAWREAIRNWGAAEGLREQGGFVVTLRQRRAHTRFLEEARATLGEARYAAAWNAGRTTPADSLVGSALESGA